MSNLTAPLQFQGSQDVYIISSLQLNCNSSLSTMTKWKIIECASNCSNEIQLDPSVVTTGSELFIPAKVLSYGTYELKLTVTMVASPNLTSSASTHVRISSSDIIVNLIQFGTSMIVHGYQQDLTLNPGTYSVDPDTNTFNTSVSNYLNFECNNFIVFYHRIGIMNITVESIVFIPFQVLINHC